MKTKHAAKLRLPFYYYVHSLQYRLAGAVALAALFAMASPQYGRAALVGGCIFWAGWASKIISLRIKAASQANEILSKLTLPDAEVQVDPTGRFEVLRLTLPSKNGERICLSYGGRPLLVIAGYNHRLEGDRSGFEKLESQLSKLD